jgi:hypothetical protein
LKRRKTVNAEHCTLLQPLRRQLMSKAGIKRTALQKSLFGERFQFWVRPAVVVVFLAFMLTAKPALAVTTGSISGTVQDAQGAVVPDVRSRPNGSDGFGRLLPVSRAAFGPLQRHFYKDRFLEV